MGSARAEDKGSGQMSEPLDFDPDALREKYRHERDRRLRPEANDQYVEITADFRHYIDDPHVDPGFTRKPLTDAVDVVIVGGGFGGLLAAARLRESGVNDIRIIEKGRDFGGTWYAAAGRDRLHPQGEIQLRQRDPCACASHWRALRPLSPGLLPDRDQRDALAAGREPMADHHQPRRRHARPLRGHLQRSAEPAEAARHPGHRDLQGP